MLSEKHNLAEKIVGETGGRFHLRVLTPFLKLSVKVLGVIRRLKKKKQTLQNRRTKAAQKHKANPTADGKKLIAATDKELKTVVREIDKNVRARKTVTDELGALRAAVRRLKAHAKAIEKVEKELNKPPKRRRRRSS